jgi:hypothetical protein
MPLYTNGVGVVAAAFVDCIECGGMEMVEKGVVIGEMGVSASRGPENGRLSEGMTARKARTSAKAKADPSLRSGRQICLG